MAGTTDILQEAAKAIPVRNAWYLLLYAWDMALWRDSQKSAVEASPHLLGLLARMLAVSAKELLRQQLGRAHAVRSDLVRGIRGRVDFDASLRRMAFQHGSAYCTFTELNVDTPKNRIIRATLHRLAGEPRLVHPDQRKEAELRSELRSLVSAMSAVRLVKITISDFSRLQLSRNDRDYALPIAISRLVFRLEMPAEGSGDHALTALLRDEIKFRHLFERFVRNFYRFNLQDCRVGGESLSWHDELNNALTPMMDTDVSIEEKLPPYRRVVIDTKYSISTLTSTPFGGKKFKSENLYQIYAYLRTQEHLSERHCNASGILLYPKTSEDVDSEMRVQGHSIRIATVNLADEWPNIETRLLALVGCNAANTSKAA
jgi:5-methylcytosine-specific restriction enzyme subunit McrC